MKIIHSNIKFIIHSQKVTCISLDVEIIMEDLDTSNFSVFFTSLINLSYGSSIYLFISFWWIAQKRKSVVSLLEVL